MRVFALLAVECATRLAEVGDFFDYSGSDRGHTEPRPHTSPRNNHGLVSMEVALLKAREPKRHLSGKCPRRYRGATDGYDIECRRAGQNSNDQFRKFGNHVSFAFTWLESVHAHCGLSVLGCLESSGAVAARLGGKGLRRFLLRYRTVLGGGKRGHHLS